MLPKEKAKELVEKFKPHTWSGASYIGIEEVEMMRDNPKQCALITVDEIISELPDTICGYMTEEGVPIGTAMEIDNMKKHYWQQVKKEIETIS